MKNILARFAPGLLVVAVASGSGVAITTIAHAQTAPPAPIAPHQSMGGGMHGRHLMMEVERLKTSLKLTAAQAALWDRAQQQMRPPTDMREMMKARHERITAMLDDPNFDPRRLAAEMDRAETERHAKMTAMRDAWFAVYDSLDPVQRGQVREFLRSHMSRMHHRGGQMGWNHERDGRGGDASTPSPSR